VSDKNKVIWSEGLFLRPQHLQQQERHFRHYVEGRAGTLLRHGWGMLELELDRELLAVGKLALRRARGVFQDGTPFSMPDDDALPAAFEVPSGTVDRVVHLVLPTQRSGAVEVERQPQVGAMTRYTLREFEARDVTATSGMTAAVEVGCVRARLLPEGLPLEDFVCVPVARIRECRADRQVLLDETFMPTALDLGACAPLARFLQELLGMVRQRAEVLSAQVTATGRGGVAELEDFLRLQVFNRNEPLLAHLARSRPVHPEELYRALLTLVGELSTLSGGSRRLPPVPEYLHGDLRSSFESLQAMIRGYLDLRPSSGIVAIPVELKAANAYFASVSDLTLFDGATFILGVRAQLPGETLRRQFGAMTKVAPAALLRKLVDAHLSGIDLQPLTVLPPRLPFRANTQYLELNQQHPLWKELRGSGGFGLYVPDGLPGLELEMWALRT